MKEVDDGTLNPPSAEMGAHMTTMLYAIVNTQNYQIHQMEARVFQKKEFQRYRAP